MMNPDRERAFDNFAKHCDADECDRYIKEILAKLQNDRQMKPSDRDLWLEDLDQWIRHYRMRVVSAQK